MNNGTTRLTRMRIAPILLLTGQKFFIGFVFYRLPNMTLCGPARDTILSDRQTGKLNFDNN